MFRLVGVGFDGLSLVNSFFVVFICLLCWLRLVVLGLIGVFLVDFAIWGCVCIGGFVYGVA